MLFLQAFQGGFSAASVISFSSSQCMGDKGRTAGGRAYLRVQQQCQKVQNQTHLHSPEVSGMKMGERHHLELRESARQREVEDT